MLGATLLISYVLGERQALADLSESELLFQFPQNFLPLRVRADALTLVLLDAVFGFRDHELHSLDFASRAGTRRDKDARRNELLPGALNVLYGVGADASRLSV